MSNKTAYVWGPISIFSGCLLSQLLEKGWHLHIASKSALQFSLSPLDLTSSAQHNIEKAAGGPEKLKPYCGKIVFLESEEPQRGTNYDIVLFMGLPSNFDEPRVSRAPWAADELAGIISKVKQVPIFVVSSLWGGIQSDGAVPEEIEFSRRKPQSNFENSCQQYETRILKAISNADCKWHLVRLPLVLGSSIDGRSTNFTGLYNLLQELYMAARQLGDSPRLIFDLNYNPDATFWMLPCDWAANLVRKLIEDSSPPVICNVVSTQSTLNQEWMQELAKALGCAAIQASEKDDLNLPPALRSMLTDNVQVKTHNLYELLGRYQRTPMVLTADYFSKVLQYACLQSWGQLHPQAPEFPFSPEKCRAFFEAFLPAKLDEKMLDALNKFSGGIAFQIDGEENCRWLLRYQDGKALVTPLDPANHLPQVCFRFAAQSFVRLVSGQMMFEAALFNRALQVLGKNPIQNLLACDFFRRFVRLHHFDFGLENQGKLSPEAGHP
jgi:hypothetical protein